MKLNKWMKVKVKEENGKKYIELPNSPVKIKENESGITVILDDNHINHYQKSVKQLDLFGNKAKEKSINKIDDHWIDMPEFNSKDKSKPFKIAIIKFRNEKDFDRFNKLVKKRVFKKVFQWGSYKSNVKIAWYPAREQPKHFAYVNEEDIKEFGDLVE